MKELGMSAYEIFRILAVILAIATMAILIATRRVKGGWMRWFAIPVVTFLWYWILACLCVAYYTWRVSSVR
jgi:hypothetical protein